MDSKDDTFCHTVTNSPKRHTEFATPNNFVTMTLLFMTMGCLLLTADTNAYKECNTGCQPASREGQVFEGLD